MQKEYITDFPINDLIPYEKNPRRNDKAVAALAEEIVKVGNNDPIEVNEENVILCGHTRLKALKKLGYKTTDILRITGLTDKTNNYGMEYKEAPETTGIENNLTTL